MDLVDDRILYPTEVLDFLSDVDESTPCAVVLVGPLDDTDELARECLEARGNAVVLRIAIQGEIVHIAARDPRLEQLIDALQQLVTEADGHPEQRSFELQLPAPANEPWPVLEAPPAEDFVDEAADWQAGDVLELHPPARVLQAAINWVHSLLRAAAGRLLATDHETIEFTRVQIVDWLDRERGPQTALKLDDGTERADAELTEALACSVRSAEPLARVAHALNLDAAEIRFVILILAPELDLRHQHWISLLLDDSSRRVGSLALYEELLPLVHGFAGGIGQSGRIADWRLIEGARDVLPAADAALRLDPPVRSWLLGDHDGLERDPALLRFVRTSPWPGARLVHDVERAKRIMERVGEGGEWLILAGDGGPSSWRALLEAGVAEDEKAPLRVDLGASLPEPIDSADLGVRLSRLARLTCRPLILDASMLESTTECDASLKALLGSVGVVGDVTGAIVAADSARIARLLQSQNYAIENEPPSARARITALHRAAAEAGAHFTDEAAESLANLYPLQIDGIEQAMQIALARPLGQGRDAARARFITACKMVSAEGATGLAQRIEPIFELSDVVLPDDRKGQLEEIVDNIRFAPKVLEGWKFRDQLPYGLGVTALFHGPSGTGKTMASMAVAKALGVQILKIDLSRVVSKYIGETEKNIDRVFQEAQLSGAALVIDEADGLLAKRSEVKDAHDRYANLEVAYLLQRMEAFEGLAILTTNLRQNLDSAFLRRLRFVVEFPRPDATAREEIWRRCLPSESHAIDDSSFRVLARRVELTGGSIRQITLRAAFLAAAAGQKIGPQQIAHAAQAEFAKLGLVPVELDFTQRQAA
jgi:AAA+ superfamily predicted ATPase